MMTAASRNRLLVGTGLVAAVVGFLLFRPDTLFTDVRVNEPLEGAFVGSAGGSSVAESVTTVANNLTTTEAAPGEVIEVVAGQFVGIDHSAAGTINVYEQAGQYVLRFEDDTDIQNGPDLYVWVLPSPSYDGGIPTDYLDLGKLTGNVGSQNYSLPESFDPEVHRTVLIWCLRFAVPFAAAPLN